MAKGITKGIVSYLNSLDDISGTNVIILVFSLVTEDQLE